MTRFKNHKSILLSSVLAIGISVITSQNVFATTMATKSYTVKSGDCLSLIAQNYGESLNNLRKSNNCFNDLILPGQVLSVSVADSSTMQQTESVGIKYTAGDLDLLSRLITAEAQDQSYNAQVAVGAVVVNRVKSSSFPNSISDVINQRTNGCYEFTTVLNGSINKPAQSNAVKAAYAALNGNDPTNNALFFYDGIAPKVLTLPQPVSITIDNLTFVYLLKN